MEAAAVIAARDPQLNAFLNFLDSVGFMPSLAAGAGNSSQRTAAPNVPLRILAVATAAGRPEFVIRHLSLIDVAT